LMSVYWSTPEVFLLMPLNYLCISNWLYEKRVQLLVFQCLSVSLYNSEIAKDNGVS
jgi:hypothetical protein